MKILITGSRNYYNVIKMEKAIAHIKPDIIVHGGARGADTIAGQIARKYNIEVRKYLADWEKHGKSAGPRRNQEMLDKEHLPYEPIDLVLAFPLQGSIGTYDMIKKAEKANISIVEIN